MFEVTREMRLSIKLWFFLPGKLSEVEILCTSRRYLVNYSVNWASTRAAHITMSATLPFVPSDRTFPFHQRNIFSVFPHRPVFTFAFTAKTAMRVKNCHLWKQEQFVGNGTYNSWQVPQVSFFFWGALKQNQMSSHCNILIFWKLISRDLSTANGGLPYPIGMFWSLKLHLSTHLSTSSSMSASKSNL